MLAASVWLGSLVCLAIVSAERQRLLDAPDDNGAVSMRVRRGAALALALRGSIGVVTLVIVAVGAHLLDR
jgi:hypothetical protein